jgi:hypothetical protein
MSESTRSFWSSIPGLVTGLAGLLTGVVGLVTVLMQLDVIGGDDSKDPSPAVATTVAGSPATDGRPAGTPTTQPPEFALSTTTLEFKPTDPKEKDVTVRNTGSVPLRLTPPEVEGTDSSQFRATLGTCSGQVGVGGVCTLKVSFTPAGPLKTYTATLEVGAVGAGAETVQLKATTVL